MHRPGKVMFCTLLCLLSLSALTDTHRRAQASGESSSSAPASAQPAARTQHRVHPDAPPDGVSAQNWAGIRRAYEANRHRAFRVAAGYQARNPGQQWQTHFDGRGFAVQPEAGAWRWGLALRSYGFPDNARWLADPDCVTAQGGRIAYAWDETLEEWFVNDTRGLEHGFTIKARPAGGTAPDARLELRLAVRGGLRPRVQGEGRDVSFVDEQGQAVVNYSGLTVYDADGRRLPAQFAAAGAELRLVVDECGARYPLTIDPWAQQAYLKASNTEANDQFGFAVAISGDTIVVGAPLEDSNATGVNGNQANNSTPGAGAAYVFVRSGTTWSQQAYLKASNTEVGDLFGWVVAISSDTIVVGAYLEDSNATGVNGNQADNSAANAGAAYVFVRSGTTWSQQAYLKASNTEVGDLFGRAVAISSGTVVVGAFEEDSNATGVNGNQADNSAANAGAAYVFVRSGTTWSQQAYLKASNTGASDIFGIAVAISGDTIVVGAPAESSNATGVNGNQADNSAPSAGAAYVFVRNGTTWSQQAYLKASNTEVGDGFGGEVALSGDTIVVSAVLEDSNATGVNGNQADNSASVAGAAYVFVRSGTTWGQQAYLKASNTEANDQFGDAVAVSGDTIVVGAALEDSNATGVNGNQGNNSAANAGAAYVFVRSGVTWSQQAYLKASNTEASDQFGLAVAISGDTIVVGALSEDSNAAGVNGNQANNSASDAGAAYVFVRLIAPTISKAFNPTSIPTGGSSTVTLTLTNTNAIALTNGSFNDLLLGGLSATGGAVSGTCTGTTPALLTQGQTALSFSGITIPALGSCTVTFAVTSTTPGTPTNQTSGVTTTQTPTAGSASNVATLTVVAPPALGKTFTPATINAGGVSQLTLSFSNPAGNVALTNLAVTDNLPLGVTIATTGATSTCGGAVTGATAGSTSFSLNGGALAAGASCQVQVTVTSTTPGTVTNTTTAPTATGSGINVTGTPASARLTVNPIGAPTVSKAFSPTSIASGGTSTLTITLGNPNPSFALSGATLTDTLPADLTTVAATAATTCGGMASQTATSVSLSGGTIPAGGSCTLTVQVTSTTPGSYTNDLPAGALTTNNGGANTASTSATLTVNAVPDTPIVSIVDPFGCTGSGDVLTVTVQITNPAVIAQTVTFTGALPAGLIGLAGTGTSTVGTPPTVTAGSASFSPTSLGGGQTVTVTYQVQVGDVASGVQLCINTTSTFNGVAGPAAQACATVDCPLIGPGLPFPATTEVSDQKAGSVLVYNLYASSASALNSQNTRLSITNVNPASDIAVHLFFVDGQTCSIADAIICLTKNQTASFLASDLDPGTTGYIVAVASDPTTGCPVNFNFLIGDVYVKLSSGHAANLGAEAFSALAGGRVACDGNSVAATLNFDGVSYNRVPRTLAASSVPARTDGNDTLLVVNRFGGNLAISASTLSNLFGIFYDDAENALSFTFSPGTCQFRSSLSNNFTRTTPRLENFIAAGHSGWLRLYSTSDIGLLGAVLNFNPNAGTTAGAFNQGRNLHKLTLSSAQTLIIPIFPPNCLD